MKIGIVGSGNVGGTLGTRWARAGHQVVFGSRDPSGGEMRKLVGEAGANASAASQQDAAQQSDVVLLATPWPVTVSVAGSLGGLSGKILIDATNPLRPKLDGLEVGVNTSGAEQVAAAAKGARVVKAFNTVGYNVMADPSFGSDRAVMFYAGDDGEAKSTVASLAAELGFEAVDAGPLTQARVLEPFALLWISLAMAGGREMAFKYLRR